MKMKINMQMNIKDFGKLLNPKSLGRVINNFFYKRLQLLALLIILLSALFLIFLWYSYIFNSNWSEARIQNYTQTRQKKSDAIFNKENFRKVIEESNARNIEFEKKLDNINDIFRLKK